MPVHVEINLKKVDFPEIGTPVSPVESKKFKGGREDKKLYGYYTMVCNSLSSFETDSIRFDKLGGIISFDMEREISKTYKFLGMDIDEDFRAVIQIPAGKVIIGNLFNPKKMREYARDPVVEDRINGLTSDDVRGIATALKMGAIYSLKKSADRDGSLNAMHVSKLLELLPSESSVPVVYYKSVIMALLNRKKIEDKKVYGNKVPLGSVDASANALYCIFRFWKELGEVYSRMSDLFGCLDFWTNFNKNSSGSDLFNARMSKCVSITDGNGNPDSVNMISFSGSSVGGTISDSSVVRNIALSTFESVTNMLLGNSGNDADLSDVLLGMIEYDKLDEIQAVRLSPEELQAFSVIDSLSYIDDDASLVSDSYDMKDPEERALYVKSVIRSYEKNFKSFKPADDYDLTDGIAEIVETMDEKRVVFRDDSGNEIPAPTYLTNSEVGVVEFKKDLIKILKLLDLALTRVGKGF